MPRNKEHILQSSIFNVVEKILPALRPYMFAIPNGGERNILVAKKLKAEGVTAGVYDIFISIPNLYHHGLYIECKALPNKIKKGSKQELFGQRMEEIGYICRQCFSVDHFENICCNYFGLTRLSNKEILSRINLEKHIQKKMPKS